MARPVKEGIDYFPHDTDASSDEKIEILTSLYGNDGYAFYFIMLERIYRNSGCFIDISDAQTKEEIFLILSRKIRVSLELFQKMLQTTLKYGLFSYDLYNNEGKITSNGILKRAGFVMQKREYMREKREQKKVSDTQTQEQTSQQTPQSKVKERKEKENIS